MGTAAPPPPSACSPARLAALAVECLADEARLTPKPGLVDARGSGAHHDLDLAVMLRSTCALRPAFEAMASAATDAPATQALRERLAVIGRDGERAMLAATGGANAHRGAIWSLGLLVAGAAMDASDRRPRSVAARAAAVARHTDRFAPGDATHGAAACARFGVPGARGEAGSGFPHAVEVGLPALQRARRGGAAEDDARLDALLAIMARLADTCLLHRGGRPALEVAWRGAATALALGGASTAGGREAMLALDAELLARNASPGGSADLLAAVLFLDRLHAPAAVEDPARR